jgi:hypothetical protein
VKEWQSMLLMFLNAVMVTWLFILAVSSSMGLLLAKTIGSRLRLRTLVVLTVVNLVGISAVVFMLLMPMHSEAQVYATAEIAAVLIIVLLCILPSTIFFWFVRFMKKPQVP